MNYQDTYLWKNSLDNETYGYTELREKLKKDFYRIRENAEFILEKIRNDFPSLTVHDITHVDSLWQTGSVIVGKEYELNPLEGFVLGCAFLFHDAVLSYEAAGGKECLRDTKEWKDYYADYKEDKNLSNEEKLYETDFSTIRRLHAKYAEKLYIQLFHREDGSSFYIIEDEAIRTHMGENICKIAGSHHWNIDDVEQLGKHIPAPYDFPNEWRINPIKLACILRCADAGHIDAGRAPDYLIKLLKVNGVSRNHWIAQNRLLQIDTDLDDKEKVIVRSDVSFKEEDFAAWNVAYDAVCVFDRELKASNELLKRKRIKEFQAKGVTGAESQVKLCKYIETEGWFPCDADIHISNVEELIKSLGGEKLYGKIHKLEIVLRELIQNGRDAICARREREDGFEGEICISVEMRDGERWVTVKDNGIGMSLSAIKNYFLNFGCSYWASDLAKSEYPGLRASGFKSVGHFGIGFFAIFMVSSKVIVESRRYDEGLNDAIEIKFPTGLCLHPIVSHKRAESSSYTTMVSFCIDANKVQWNDGGKIGNVRVSEESFKVPYSAVISRLVAGLDVDLYYCEYGEKVKKIHTNINNFETGSLEISNWLKEISYANYHGGTLFTDYIEKNYKRLRRIYSDGQCFGIAAINTFWNQETSFFEVTTIGGLDTFDNPTNPEFIGCIIAEADTASRRGILNNFDKKEWAHEQYKLLCEEGLTDMDKLRLPYILGKYGIDMTEVMHVRTFDKNGKLYDISLKELLERLNKLKEKLILPLSQIMQNRRLDNYLDYERTCMMMDKGEWLYVVEQNSDFLSINEEDKEFPFNIMGCITHLAQRYGIKINKTIEENRAMSRFEGKCKCLVISAE